jgi:hypothetical protein
MTSISGSRTEFNLRLAFGTEVLEFDFGHLSAVTAVR